LPYHLVYG
jgi:hypothetical protein